ncbi:hypothetical protein EDB82DRAFT_509703 [Fusarium venenatum]|uniref:uncharacterized protein n=1 Tax=Fusarium venenatum TaxID=56646 RepID=UPI001D36B2E0|nr:hypothetical protein EDB82DRAFT_509703 [Fusarium venenatum]
MLWPGHKQPVVKRDPEDYWTSLTRFVKLMHLIPGLDFNIMTKLHVQIFMKYLKQNLPQLIKGLRKELGSVKKTSLTRNLEEKAVYLDLMSSPITRQQDGKSGISPLTIVLKRVLTGGVHLLSHNRSTCSLSLALTLPFSVLFAAPQKLSIAVVETSECQDLTSPSQQNLANMEMTIHKENASMNVRIGDRGDLLYLRDTSPAEQIKRRRRAYAKIAMIQDVLTTDNPTTSVCLQGDIASKVLLDEALFLVDQDIHHMAFKWPKHERENHLRVGVLTSLNPRRPFQVLIPTH